MGLMHYEYTMSLGFGQQQQQLQEETLWPFMSISWGTWDSKHDVLNEFCVVQERKDIYFSNLHLSFLLYMEKLECISFL